MPQFFTNRIAIWAVLAVLFIALTGILAYTTGQPELIAPGLLLAIGCAFYGYQIYQIARKGEYFVMRLTCQAIQSPNLLNGITSYFDPTSQTAFRRSKTVIFTTEQGQTISFTYERNRRFVVGGKYDFYFRKPTGTQDLTVEELERLRIDHKIVNEKIQVH